MTTKATKKPAKKRTGRRSYLTPERQAIICTEVQLGATDKDAAAEAGISYHTMAEWVRKGERDQAAGLESDYSTFAKELTQARALRPNRILARLATYKDFRADDAYLKQHRGRKRHKAELAKLEAEARAAEAHADLIEAKARITQALADGTGKAGTIMMAGELLEVMPEGLRVMFEAWLRECGLELLQRGSIGDGPTKAELEETSPTPLTLEVKNDG